MDAQRPAAGGPPAGQRPSVIYGLIGVLVIVPFIGNHLITEAQKESVAGVIRSTATASLAGGR